MVFEARTTTGAHTAQRRYLARNRKHPGADVHPKRSRNAGAGGEKPGKRIRKKKPSSVKTRTRQTNKKKLELLRQSDVIKASGGSSGHDDEFRRSNPSVPLETLRRWRRPSNRAQIEADGESKSPAVRDARVSSVGLAKHRAKFPAQETELFDHILERRADGFSVQCWYVKSKMKEFVRRDKPEGYATFTASDRWRIRFFTRFRLTVRATTNVKSHTVEERLPQVRGFHLFMKEVQVPLVGTPQSDDYARW